VGRSGARKAELLAELEPLVSSVEPTSAGFAADRLETTELERTQTELDSGEADSAFSQLILGPELAGARGRAT